MHFNLRLPECLWRHFPCIPVSHFADIWNKWMVYRTDTGLVHGCNSIGTNQRYTDGTYINSKWRKAGLSIKHDPVRGVPSPLPPLHGRHLTTPPDRTTYAVCPSTALCEWCNCLCHPTGRIHPHPASDTTLWKSPGSTPQPTKIKSPGHWKLGGTCNSTKDRFPWSYWHTRRNIQAHYYEIHERQLDRRPMCCGRAS